MREATVELYTFEELDTDVQEKVIEHHREFSYEDSHFWFESMVEDAKETASFKIESLNDNPIGGEGVFLIDAETTARAILENHGDVCGTHKVAREFIHEWEKLTGERDGLQEKIDDADDREYSETWNAQDEQKLHDALSEVEDEIEELENQFARDVAHEYGVLWSKEIEYQTSDEVIKENITANEYEFLQDGRSPRL